MTPVTQENFRLLLPGKIAAIVEMRREARHCSSRDALSAFYRSSLYRELEDEATKRWWESPAQLYHEWKD